MEVFDARHVCRVPDAPEMQRMRKARNPEVYRAVWGPNEWTMLGSVREWNVRRQLRDLDLPVLITAGEHDLCTEAVISELQEGIPAAHTEVFEGTSHMPYIEDPAAIGTTPERIWETFTLQGLRMTRLGGSGCHAT